MASKKFVVDIDLNGNKLLHLLLDPLSSDPTGEEPRIYYNTVSKVVRYYDGTEWKTLATTSDVATVATALSTLESTVAGHTTDIEELQETIEELIGGGSGSIEDIVDTRVMGQLNMTYDSTTHNIYLFYGETRTTDNTIGTVDCSDFIKDGMIDEVAYNSTTHILTFTWNTAAGKSDTEIDLTGLIDTYTAGNGLSLTNGVFALKLDTSSESFLTLGSGGLKLSGVQTAINNAIQAYASEGVHYIVDVVTSGDSKTLTMVVPQGKSSRLINVSCFYDGSEVVAAVSTSSNHVTVSWNGLTLTAAKPLTINVLYDIY